MPNKVKYNPDGTENAIFKGNWAIDASAPNTGGGPSSITGFYNGADAPEGGYVMYEEGAVRIIESDEELISYVASKGGDSGSLSEAIEWTATQSNTVVVNRTIESIPTDGLKLYLDSRNTASYSGGSTWYDLAQGIKFNQVGTPLPVLDILGDPSFEFNSSGYWQSESNHGLVDMGGETTLLMWVDSTNIGERDTIFEKAGVQYNSYEHEIAVTWETNERFTWYSRRGTYGYGSTTSLSTSGWYLVGIKMSNGKTGGVARRGWYSINGGSWVENYTDRGTTAILPAGAIRIGSGYAGPVESGGISVVMVYDRQLTNDEVSQIYTNQSPYFT